MDILEVFHNQLPGKATQTLHFPASISYNTHSRSTRIEEPAELGGWHTLAVEIEPLSGGAQVRFRFLIDGVVTTEYTNTKPQSWNGVDPNGGWDIALNMAVGGNWVGEPEGTLGYLPYVGKCSLTYSNPPSGVPGNCPTTGLRRASFPDSYVIDWVRVYTR